MRGVDAPLRRLLPFWGETKIFAPHQRVQEELSSLPVGVFKRGKAPLFIIGRVGWVEIFKRGRSAVVINQGKGEGRWPYYHRFFA